MPRPDDRPRSRKRLRRLLVWLSAAALTALVAVGIGAWRVRQLEASGDLTRILAERLADELGMAVRVDRAWVHGVTRIAATGLVLTPPPDALELRAKVLGLSLDYWALMRGTIQPWYFDLGGLDLDLTTPAQAAALGRTLALIEQRSRVHKPTITVNGVHARLAGGLLDVDYAKLRRPYSGMRKLDLAGRWTPDGLPPASFTVDGLFSGSPSSLVGKADLQSDWAAVQVGGSILSLSGTPSLELTVRLARIDLGALAKGHLLPPSPVRSGLLAGILRLAGSPSRPELSGQLQPTAVVAELPRLGLVAISSGTVRVTSEALRMNDLPLQTTLGELRVKGTVRPPLAEPRCSLRAAGERLDAGALARVLGLPMEARGTFSAELSVDGRASSPEVSAEVDVQQIASSWPVPRLGEVPFELTGGHLSYSDGALRSPAVEGRALGMNITVTLVAEALGRADRITAEARALDVDTARLVRRLPGELGALGARYRLHGRTALTVQLAGSRGDYSWAVGAVPAGLGAEIPAGETRLPVEVTGGSLTMVRGILYGQRLEGLCAGSRFAGDLVVEGLADDPKPTGTFLFRKAQLARVAPAAARQYALQGAPDVRLELGKGPDRPWLLSADARGLGLVVTLDSGTRVPVSFTGGLLELDAGMLRGTGMTGQVAGGRLTGKVELADPLGSPRVSGETQLQSVELGEFLPPGARQYRLAGKTEATLAFSPGHTALECGLTGLRARLPVGGGELPLECMRGQARWKDGTLSLAKVELAVCGREGGRLGLDGGLDDGSKAIDVSLSGLGLGRVAEAVTGSPARWNVRLGLNGKVARTDAGPVLTGRFQLSAAGSATTTLGRLLEGSGGELTAGAAGLRIPEFKVAGLTASLKAEPTAQGYAVNAAVGEHALEPVLTRFGSPPGVARGSLTAAARLAWPARRGAVPQLHGNVSIAGLTVDGRRLCSAMGISNPSTKLRGAGGFLSLGLLPGFWNWGGRLASGRLNMNARYVDFVFREHDLGDLRWDFRLQEGELAGPVKSPPDGRCIDGRMAVDLGNATAKGQLRLASTRGGLGVKVEPLLVDTSASPPARTPKGLDNVSFSGAGSAFDFAGAAGSAVLGGLLKGGTMTLGPAAMIPVLLMGDMKKHKKYTGEPGTRPSASEATVVHPQRPAPATPPTTR